MQPPDNMHLLLGSLFLVVFVVLASAVYESTDVKPGDDVVLQCRFNPVFYGEESNKASLYWTRTNKEEKDNVAIGKTPLEQNYRIDYRPREGKYDLLISNASYDRDNGQFECRLVEGGTGNDLHSKSIQLTVLISPGPPKISPNNPIATEDSAMELECASIGGSPDPEIRWYLNSAPNPLRGTMRPGGGRYNRTTSVLRIIPRREDDGNQYRCEVWNRALKNAQKLETNVSLNVNYFPRVTVSPTNPLRIEKDTTAHLSCSVDAKPSVNTVTWSHNGSLIGNQYRHMIHRVSVQDEGIYVCSADNGLGQVRDAELRLYVLYGPIVSVQPQVEVDKGEDIVLQCKVDANPPPTTTEWLKDGDEDFRQNGGTLRLSRVSETDSGKYMCRAVNFFTPYENQGSAVRVGNATVSVFIRHQPGSAHIIPEEPVAIDGSSFNLTCEANSSGWPLPQFHWWKQGSQSEILGRNSNLFFQVVSPQDEGIYVCQPKNEVGSGKTKNVTLKVYQPPMIITHLQSNAIEAAGSADFNATCQARGKPKPSVHWLKDGKEINHSSPMYKIIVDERERRNSAFTVESTLKFLGPHRIRTNHLSPADRGKYTCIFENEVKKAETSMMLKIQHSPILLHQDNKVAFNVGETAIIICKMQAFPGPQFTWEFSNEIINKGSNYQQSINPILGDDTYQAILEIVSVREEDYGDYTCRAKNDNGINKTIIKLKPKGLPESPVNIWVVTTSYDRVTLEWEEGFNGGYQDTKFIVSYKPFGYGRGIEYDCQMKNPCNISGLEQQQAYSFKVKAYNMKGESDFSKNITASTKVDISQIPQPQHVTYESKSRSFAFSVINSRLLLVASVEIKGKNGSWRLYTKLPVTSNREGAILRESEGDIQELRVRFCLETNKNLCGDYRIASEVDSTPVTAPTGLPTHYIIAIVVSCVIVLLFIMLVLIFCCCRQKQKKVKKEYEMESSNIRPNIMPQKPPPPYYTSGIENKGVDHSMDVSMDDTSKGTIYNTHNGYSYHTVTNGIPNGHIPNGGVNVDYSNYSISNNGGSLNSEDNQWMGKPNGDVQHVERQYQYDPLLHGGYMVFDDYSQYSSSNNDYLNQQNREYILPNGDPYAAVHKTKKRMDVLDTPYHDVSGLPDPYLDHESDENKTQHISMSFDESLESGYSTPNSRNRRIIREIIV